MSMSASNVFIAAVMAPLYYWPFVLVNRIDVKALFIILKRQRPIDCVAAIHNVRLTCEKNKNAYPASTQSVSGNRGCIKYLSSKINVS